MIFQDKMGQYQTKHGFLTQTIISRLVKDQN